VYYQPAAGVFRLPTEAEWEYAARGGPFHIKKEYAGADRVKDAAWHRDNSNDETQSVCLLQPNALVLYDMSGNVLEWCWDWKGNYQKSSKHDPLGPKSSSNRVLRGGSWNGSDRHVRASVRFNLNPDVRYFNLGFRLARTV
jgi:formylglycine-generating enzyme required for sulfatase activity